MTPLRRNSGPGPHHGHPHAGGSPTGDTGRPAPRRNDAAGGMSLGEALEHAGFYPELVADTLDEVLDGRAVATHLVHVDTHFDFDEIHRHITVLVLAEDVLAALHLDDHALDDDAQHMLAQVSTELIPLRRIDSVVATSIHPRPETYRRGDPVAEVTLAITWAGGQRVDLAPAGCADPECEADHGYTGTTSREDLALRVAAEAEGQQAVDSALAFARALRRATVDSSVESSRDRSGR